MYANDMLTEAGRKVLTEISKHGALRTYSHRSKYSRVAPALLDHRDVRPAGVGCYTITAAGEKALAR